MGAMRYEPGYGWVEFDVPGEEPWSPLDPPLELEVVDIPPKTAKKPKREPASED